MKEMLCTLKQRGYKQTSLAIQKANYAVDRYKKTGFQIVDENEGKIIPGSIYVGGSVGMHSHATNTVKYMEKAWR